MEVAQGIVNKHKYYIIKDRGRKVGEVYFAKMQIILSILQINLKVMNRVYAFSPSAFLLPTFLAQKVSSVFERRGSRGTSGDCC